MSISRILLGTIAVLIFTVPYAVAAAEPTQNAGITLLYSADERGEIEPCG